MDASTSASDTAGKMTFPTQACVQMFNAHPDAHWLLDEAGVLKHANRAALRLMGNVAEVPAGTNITQLVADGALHCTELLRQGLRTSVPTPARLRLRQSGGSEVTCRCEIALLSPASAGVPAMLWCRLVEHTLGNHHFEVLNQQIQALKREVGRRQAAESEMRQQSEWLETVLLGIAQGVVATDLDGYVLFMNQVAADLTGWPRALSMGRPVARIVQLVRKDAPGEVSLPVLDSRQIIGGDLDRSRMQLTSKNGTTCLVEVSVSPLTSESGVLRGAVVVLHSVESEQRAEKERLALEHQLRESQKMEALGTMAGGVAHDFNNIVAAILGNVELALADTPPESEVLISLHEIRKAGRRARDLVQQILTFSRRQDNTRGSVSVRSLMHEAQSMLRTVLSPEAELEITLDHPLPTIWANATQIEQVFLNLMGNALQALQGRPSGKVGVIVSSFVGSPPPVGPDEVEVIAVGSEWPTIGVSIQVSDNGVGMTPETLSHIFEPFFTTKATGSGTGLGLAVVHGILREHNAVLRVRSAPEQGTVFTVLLPGMEGAEAVDALIPDGTTSIAKAAPRAARVPHILYIDDDESMAFLVKRFLDRSGFRVTTCIGPEEAMACLQSGQSEFTLCITDYNMPRMSGLSLAKEIKARWPGLSIAIASGYISDELREQAPEAGVDELIYKPDTVEDLCRTIERLLERNLADQQTMR